MINMIVHSHTRESKMQNNRLTTIDAVGKTLSPNNRVICVDAVVGGDNDNINDWDIKQGGSYIIESVFDDDNLITPMVNIIGSKNGPFLAARFLLEGERVALDCASNVLKTGDRVTCVDESEGGDSGLDFDLQKGQKYIVDSVFDEPHSHAPMICLIDSESGPVFPERFKKTIQP